MIVGHVHPVPSTASNSYGYDANGNMTSRTEGGLTYTQQFDAENRLTSVTQGTNTTTYVYDGNGARVKQIVNGQTTIYIGNYYEKAPDGTITKYYYFDDRRVVERRAGTLYYLYGDHLGSTSQVADSIGAELGQQRYFPFGTIRYSSGNIPSDFGFTGQRFDAASGLISFNARFYDPVLGRFISADTLVPQPGNPQNLNRYSYVLGNPLRYTDPTGHRICEYVDVCNISSSRSHTQQRPPTRRASAALASTRPADVPTSMPQPPSPQQPSPASTVRQSTATQEAEYVGVNVSVNVPDAIIVAGFLISTVAPEVGVPIALTGGVLALTPLAYVGVGGQVVQDRYGNIYVYPQVSFVRTVPFWPISGSVFSGDLVTGDRSTPNESQLKTFLTGPTIETGSAFGQGRAVSYSPGGEPYRVAALDIQLALPGYFGVTAGWGFEIR